jgi:hypothetical protein
MWTCRYPYPAFTGIDSDRPLSAGSLSIPAGRFIIFFTLWDYLFRITIFALILLSLGVTLKFRDIHPLYAYMSIMLLITFTVYLFIEVQPRYAYFAMPALLTLAAPGIGLLERSRRRGEGILEARELSRK